MQQVPGAKGRIPGGGDCRSNEVRERPSPVSWTCALSGRSVIPPSPVWTRRRSAAVAELAAQREPVALVRVRSVRDRDRASPRSLRIAPVAGVASRSALNPPGQVDRHRAVAGGNIPVVVHRARRSTRYTIDPSPVCIRTTDRIAFDVHAAVAGFEREAPSRAIDGDRSRRRCSGGRPSRRDAIEPSPVSRACLRPLRS